MERRIEEEREASDATFATARRSDYAAQKFRGRLLVFGKRCPVFASDGRNERRTRKEGRGGTREFSIWKEAYALSRCRQRHGAAGAGWSAVRRRREEGPSISLIRSPRRPPGFRNAKHSLLLIGQSTRHIPPRPPATDSIVVRRPRPRKQASRPSRPTTNDYPPAAPRTAGPNLEFWSLNLRDKNARYVTPPSYSAIVRRVCHPELSIPRKKLLMVALRVDVTLALQSDVTTTEGASHRRKRKLSCAPLNQITV